MKIVAGLGSIDEYIKFAEAGADEFFCGYVPYSWSQKYGTVLPLNRREVLCRRNNAFSKVPYHCFHIADFALSQVLVNRYVRRQDLHRF